MQSACDEICGATAPREPCPVGRVVGRGTSAQYLICGGSVLVRRRIQTPSAAKVRSAVQREGEVVLGASPPARRINSFLSLFADRDSTPPDTRWRLGPVGHKTAARAEPVRPLMSSPQDGDDATRRVRGFLALSVVLSGACPGACPLDTAVSIAGLSRHVLVPGTWTGPEWLASRWPGGEDDELAARLARRAFRSCLGADADRVDVLPGAKSPRGEAHEARPVCREATGLGERLAP